MFVGHTAVALAAKPYAPRASLGGLLAAAYTLDLVWPVLLLAGVETVRIDPGNTAFTPLAFDSYPWSHSLLMAMVWGLVAAGIGWRFKLPRATLIILWLLVVSHWVLDFISHGPDMPLWPGSSPRLGLGLWNSIVATLVVESAMLIAGIAIYLRSTRARDRIGTIAFWSFVVVQVAMWASQPWSPPPPSTRVLAWFGIGAWLFVVWAWWIDRHRLVLSHAPAPSPRPEGRSVA